MVRLGVTQELDPGSLVMGVVEVVDVVVVFDGTSKAAPNPKGRPKLGVSSRFHEKGCALAVLPSHPASGSAIA